MISNIFHSQCLSILWLVCSIFILPINGFALNPSFTESSPQTVNMDEDACPIPFNLTLHATDPNSDPITWTISSQASNGVAGVGGTGTEKAITFDPNYNYNGSDSFTVQISDGVGGTDSLAVNVTINAIDDAPDFIIENCSWNWENPIPQGNHLKSVWGLNANNIYAVGEAGTILHYNGSNWNLMKTDQSNFEDIWGSSANNIFAVGHDGTIAHYNGSNWSSMTSTTSNDLYGVWGESGSLVFAVGMSGTVLKYDGNNWSQENSDTSDNLWSIWGSSGTNVLAVGSNGEIIHYNGTSWSSSTMSSGTAQVLWDIWGSSENNIYVSGQSGVVKKYTGTTWTEVTSNTSEDLFGIWGTSNTNYYILGNNGIILQCNESSCSEMNSTSTNHFYGIWGTSSSNIYGVGYYGSIQHYNGSNWSSGRTGTQVNLYGVTGSSSGNYMAVGDGGIILKSSGNNWSEISSTTSNALYAVWQSSDSHAVAIGASGTIIQYNGNNWSGMTSNTSYHLFGIWGNEPNDIFASGQNGKMIHYNGSEWENMTSNTSTELRDIWASASNRVFAAGLSGTIIYYNGSEWTEMDSNTSNDLWALWGFSENNIFAVGNTGTILHYDGTNWSQMASNTTDSLWNIWGKATNDIYAIGTSGIMIHYDGTDWSPVESNTSNHLIGIWGSSGNELVTVGKGGTILRLSPDPNNTFTDMIFDEASPISLTGLYAGSAAFGDYDSDGDPDILITGRDNSSTITTKLYKNTGGKFVENTDANLAGIYGGPGLFGYYDNDKDLDIFIIGYTGSERIAKIYENTVSGFTEDTAISITGVSRSSAVLGDYDNDGDLDLAYIGYTGNIKTAKLFQNTGGNYVEDTRSNLTGAEWCSIEFGDYDNDSDLDILITGDSDSGKIAKIYDNSDGIFTENTSISLPAVSSSFGEFFDADNDGDLDILIIGYASVGGRIAKVFKNNGSTFTEDTNIVLTGVSSCAQRIFDYNNDGLLDILITGNTDSGAIAKIYQNTGGQFSEDSSFLFTGLRDTSLDVADYDNDGDLDILLMGDTGDGYTTRIYRNNFNVANTVPSAPTALSQTLNGNQVTLSWTASSDSQTVTSTGLSYNIRVGTSPGTMDILSSMSLPLSSGYRLIPERGNIQTLTTVVNLPDKDYYYWSVQAIDTSFAASEFAAENGFSYGLPDFEEVSIQTTREDETHSVSLMITDAESTPCDLTITLHSSNTQLSSTENISYTCSADNYRFTLTPNEDKFGSSTITIIAQNSEGYTHSMSFDLSVLEVNDDTLVVTVLAENFENDLSTWSFGSDGQKNRWYAGHAVSYSGSSSAYISKDEGATATYDETSVSESWLTRTVDLTDYIDANLSFYWKGFGEEFLMMGHDYGEFYIHNETDILVSTAKEFINITTWTNKTIDISKYTGASVDLKFKWVNDDSSKDGDPAFCIDNILLQASMKKPGSGNALDFDGDNDYVALSDGIVSAASLGMPPTITVEAWVKVDQFTDWAGIVSFNTDIAINEGGWVLGVMSGNKFYFAITTYDILDYIYYLESDAIYLTDVWYHVAGTYDGNIMIIYINGIQVASYEPEHDGNIYYRDTYYTIGACKDSSVVNEFDGQIDEVRVWNGARSAEEIRSTMCRKLIPDDEINLQWIQYI